MGGLMVGAVGGWLGVRGNQDAVEGFLGEQVTNAAGVALVRGNVVRISADDTVTRAQADVAANAQGTVGVAFDAIANGAVGTIITEGKATVLLEAGLVGVAAGQTLWLSPTNPGRGTNVRPPEPQVSLGVLKDATNYAVDNTVVADIDPDVPGAARNDYIVTTVAIDTILDDTFEIVLVDATAGPRLITLPTAVGIRGRFYEIKKIDATGNIVTIDANGVQTIDGLLNQLLIAQWSTFAMVSDGANWMLV